MSIRREIGDRSGICPTLHNMASIARENGDIELYLEYEREAYQIAIEIQDATAIYHVGADLGEHLCRSKQINEGLPMLRNSHTVAVKGGLPDAEKIKQLIAEFEAKQKEKE